MHNIRKNKGVIFFRLVMSIIKFASIKSFINTPLFEMSYYHKNDKMDKLTDDSYCNSTRPKLKCLK